MLLPPYLSLSDPLAESEGSLDPLSLSPIYDRLADRILPSLTIRMRRIRFVTAMCVIARVCDDEYEDDAVATDEVTPPWLVLEWFVVEALVRCLDAEELKGVAGSAKVRAAIDHRRAISNTSYLKTPRVFGFSGIFRRFVTAVGVLTDDLQLDDGGYDVLRAWEKDVGCEGFSDAPNETSGGKLRERLRAALRAGMKSGSTVPRATEFWSTLAGALTPETIPNRERRVLFALLQSRAKGTMPGHAEELVGALQKRGSPLDRTEEAAFLRTFTKHASAELAPCLRAIDAYEALCRPLNDAFDLLRLLSTSSGTPVNASVFSEHRLAEKLVSRIHAGVARVKDDDNLGAWEPTALDLVERFEHPRTAAELFQTMLQHHEKVQQDKPPDGKRPWFERMDGEHAVIRAAYKSERMPSLSKSYLHDYRVPTLSRFLVELRGVS